MVCWASVVAQLVKNPPAMRETWIWSLGWEDPLEKGKATHSSILAWRIPWTQSTGLQRVRHNWVAFTSLQVRWFLIFREQKWLPLSFHLLIALSKNVMSGAEATFFRSWGKKQETHKDLSSEISEPLNQPWQPTAPQKYIFMRKMKPYMLKPLS